MQFDMHINTAVDNPPTLLLLHSLSPRTPLLVSLINLTVANTERTASDTSEKNKSSLINHTNGYYTNILKCFKAYQILNMLYNVTHTYSYPGGWEY